MLRPALKQETATNALGKPDFPKTDIIDILMAGIEAGGFSIEWITDHYAPRIRSAS